MKQKINLISVAFFCFLSFTLVCQQAEAQCGTCTGTIVNINNTTWSGAINVVNQCIYVSGNLQINTNTYFQNCTFYMSPNSSITVGTGMPTSMPWLLLKGCCIGGTTNLWQGITVNRNARIYANTNTIIKDAITGVTLMPKYGSAFGTGAFGNFNSVKFENNITGIATPYINNYSLGTLNLQVHNTEFYGSGVLLGTGNQSASNGIAMNNVLNANLTSNSLPNRFHDLKGIGTGFYVCANATVRNCKYENITNSAIEHDNIYVNPTASSPIVGSLVVEGFGSSNSSTSMIRNCRGGISAFQSGVKVTNSKIEVTTHGILVHDAHNLLQTISNNRILVNSSSMGQSAGSGYTGIDLKFNAPYMTGSKVFENYVDVFELIPNSGLAYSCIYVGEAFNNASDLTIESNNLNVNHGRYGILLSELSGVVVRGNQIFVKPIPSAAGMILPQAGIYAQQADDAKISCNWIGSNTNTGNALGLTIKSPIGIQVFNCIGSTYQGNRLGYNFFSGGAPLPTGMHFDELCNSSTITGNEFWNTLGDGLILGVNNAITGPQIDQGNWWSGTPSVGNFHAKHFGPNLPGFLFASAFVVPPTGLLEYRPAAPWVSPASGWFFYTGINGQIAHVNAQNDCHVAPIPATPYHGGFNEANFEQTYGLDPVAEFPETIDWQSSKDVYQQLLDDATLRNSDIDYANFYNSNSNSAIRYYSELERLMIDILPEYDPLLASLIEEQEVLRNQLLAIDSIYSNSDSLEDSSYLANLLSIKEPIENQIAVKNEAIQAQILLNYNNKESLRNEIASLINALPEEDLIQWNEKTISKIILQTVAVGKYDFTEQQKSDIETVALQCPLAGGKSVTTARNLWSLYDPSSKYIDDISNCNDQGFAMRNINNTKGGNEHIKIYPNPASDLLHVSGINANTSIQIILSDMLGHQIMNQNYTVNDGYVSIPVSKIPTGVYVASIYLNDGTTKQIKLSIIR